jgi:hypothetical protein
VVGGYQSVLPEASDEANVLGLLTLAARGDLELDSLTLRKRLVALGLDVRVMDKHVIAIFTADEAVPLVVVEELHSASRQSILFS